MKKTKALLVTSFALFSLFFGAGNLLLPPFLGYNAGDNWFWVSVGFILTAVCVPILGIYTHSKLQGTLYDFGKKVSPKFSLLYCVIIYLIAISIPSPRTAAATFEIAIAPYFSIDSLLMSIVYFLLVLVFVLNRSKILTLIGRYLTPIIVLALLCVIIISLFKSTSETNTSSYNFSLLSGILEGYQTFDAIGSVVVGAVIVISINTKFDYSFEEKKKLIKHSGIIAGFGLFLIYLGLISTGAFFGSDTNFNTALSTDMQRANLLRGISTSALGNLGNSILSILIALACFTTAVGIVTGTADYVKGLFRNSHRAYVITAVLSSAIGVIVGQLDFNSIVIIAIPFLLLVYPITIVLILLNVIPEKFASVMVFRLVVLATLIFSIPDVVGFIFPSQMLKTIIAYIPFAEYSFGWVLPALLAFLICNIYLKKVKISLS
ncbi:branched-chain amino acid transport system II carrier protein [Hyunsoonleella pacifica]|uniref:Branched-chain amino acid transport system II carrier protein n=1 Tax=Hyunsoonleella pacifica TaxID=1080224 RepID=A0A4Q9FNH7_9FLAO|nr:branched-chain amino acid transport system II carrier protein [Hyunsoonleella pacifica]TBN15800.1 branched-chain amino acid transport system II carrier protein [Hyunsoonleella pacifica]GGD22758.1 branched-chain amino acid transport system carrier protein [Hyunsoonleella pacifica]